jgi:SAM-dependent methyltransferase
LARPPAAVPDASNPWLKISAADYEGHMGPSGVDQLAALSGLFAEVYNRVMPARVAVLGCATGNGFEHVDPAVTRRLVGVDVNPQYLAFAREHYQRLAGILDLVCRPAETCDIGAGSMDLMFAGLFFEYVEPGPMLERIASWLVAGGTLSVVLQLPSTAAPAVSKTAYESLRVLEGFLHLVPPDELRRLAIRAGLAMESGREIPLRCGKSFQEMTFTRRA